MKPAGIVGQDEFLSGAGDSDIEKPKAFGGIFPPGLTGCLSWFIFVERPHVKLPCLLQSFFSQIEAVANVIRFPAVVLVVAAAREAVVADGGQMYSIPLQSLS